MKHFDPRQRGYMVLFHEGENTHCPGCGHSNWNVGRSMAECAFCATALPIADEGIREAMPTFVQSGEVGLHANVLETPLLMRSVMTMLMAGGLVLSVAACNTVKGAGQDVESVGKTAEEVVK
jgi:predicted small secreted protein